jgi:hypothetical protein
MLQPAMTTGFVQQNNSNPCGVSACIHFISKLLQLLPSYLFHSSMHQCAHHNHSPGCCLSVHVGMLAHASWLHLPSIVNLLNCILLVIERKAHALAYNCRLADQEDAFPCAQ